MLSFLIKFPILKRIIPSIIKRLNLKNFTYNAFGINFRLDLNYFIDRRFYLLGYDDDVINYLNKLIKKDNFNYFLDIGSCWGLYSLRISKENPNISILSFDVFKENIDRLNSMKIENNFQNITTYNLAIGEGRKIEKFSVNENYSPNYAKDLDGKFTIEVQQDCIDNLINIKNNLIVLKIDVERSELEVLKGAKNLLKDNKCFIVIETFGRQEKAVLDYLKQYGYRIVNHNLNTSDYFLKNF
jgi:FkbM family methyltransferase